MTLTIGIDVGGANTKIAALKVYDGRAVSLSTGIRYLPLWRKLSELPSTLRILTAEALQDMYGKPDMVALTMTGELSDVFKSKDEGVRAICRMVLEVFEGLEINVLDRGGRLVSVDDALKNPYSVAASNWYASGWFASQFFDLCILVDVGSTTTSIVPVVMGEVKVEGFTDLEKLQLYELVYTGALRTNLATIASRIRFRDRWVNVSSEYFAQTGDVYILLGFISAEDYICDTPDGRGLSREEAADRIARTICADTRILSMDDVLAVARYFYRRQVEAIASALRRKAERMQERFNVDGIPCITTGLGEDFLAAEAAVKAGLKPVVRLSRVTRRDVALMTPAVGLAFLAASRVEGKRVYWNPKL
ncbi:MAG: hydantoinase/oxoprolinase family protein [Candidatus Bathyarchaeia archaeon]